MGRNIECIAYATEDARLFFKAYADFHDRYWSLASKTARTCFRWAAAVIKRNGVLGEYDESVARMTDELAARFNAYTKRIGVRRSFKVAIVWLYRQTEGHAVLSRLRVKASEQRKADRERKGGAS